ncbi:cilium assembly protein DZIP1-like isoform X2 [Prorops nasuta]|uniref:cilium assembly protein DZIP1-like isoform X2 n=1 Tax=Prorops nasuta TaxID=863751 RepID=UPI0034CEA458
MDINNWYHDFPKLAKESGFYFNINRPRNHIDWSKISNIDIDCVIRERDFSIIDKNVHIILSYGLEHERDVKVLDSNFVKLFRFAQLAIEYLLYCKQYLDHSVVILKDELRLKIEDNCKLRKDLSTAQETIKQLQEQLRGKHKIIDIKNNDSHGEIHKCPHCPKTFVSGIFVNAHIARRHAYELNYSAIPIIHDHYKTETEKLHNEIKSLKERLNQTEKIIYNNTNKSINNEKGKKEVTDCEKRVFKYSDNDSIKEVWKKHSDGCPSNFSLDNSRFKGEIHNDIESDVHLKKLISQQEKEIEKLKNQLLDRLTPDVDSMQKKLHTQENYWKSKLEYLEVQHRKDIENLSAELKSTQQVAQLMKEDYSSKVIDLERKSLDQSKILTEQSEQLSSLSHGMKISQKPHLECNANGYVSNKVCSPSITVKQKHVSCQIENTDPTNFKGQQTFNNAYTSAHSDKTNELLRYSQHILKEVNSPHKYQKTKLDKESVLIEKLKSYQKIDSHPRNIESMTNVFQMKSFSDTNHKNLEFGIKSKSEKDENDSLKANKKKIIIKSLEEDIPTFKLQSSKAFTVEDKENSKSDSEFIFSEFTSETESEKAQVKNQYYDNKESSVIPLLNSNVATPSRTFGKVTSSEEIKDIINTNFKKKLKDLGLDSEWHGIPQGTFEKKMDIISHHKNINSKKFPKYNQIKRKILDELHHRLTMKNEAVKITKPLEKSPLNKLMTNVKEKAIRAFNAQKSHKGIGLKQRLHLSRSLDENILNYQDSSEIEESEGDQKKNENLMIDSKSCKQLLIGDKQLSDLQEDIFEIGQFNSFLHMKSNLIHEGEATSTPIETEQKLEFDSNLRNSSIEKLLDGIQQTPKSSKSVLKSITGSTGSLIKKKVIFDLENKGELVQSKSVGELMMEFNQKCKEPYDSDWNVSRIRHL